MLSYFPLFIFDVICRKSEMLRLVRTSAITAFFTRLELSPVSLRDFLILRVRRYRTEKGLDPAGKGVRLLDSLRQPRKATAPNSLQ